MQFSVVFANILGGHEFLGSAYGEMNFGELVLDKYVDAIAVRKPDLLSLAEVHLEDETSSEMVQYMADKLGLPHYDVMGSAKSHIAEDKILGNAILSKYPILKNDHFLVKSPMIEVDRPNGEHWVMHDKLAQTVFAKIGNKVVALTSLHYFPFHHFNRKMNDPEFAPQRESLVVHLTSEEVATIPIVTGDFNNKGFKLADAFPELFGADFSEAIEAESTIVGDTQQLDHILFKNTDIAVTASGTIQIPSDHLGLYATFEI